MGRVRTTFVKALGVKVNTKYKNKFKNDFQHNKKALDEVAEMHSKKLRNVIAGYVTTLIRKEERKK